MRRTIGVSVVLAGALIAGCTPPPAAKSEVDTVKIAEAVKADVKDLVAGFNAHDAAKAVGHDAPDYAGMMHGSANVVGPAADMALTKMQVADKAANVEVSGETVDVAKSGEMAVYRATYAYTMTDPATKKIVVEPGNWLIGYKTQADGSWKAAWSVVSNTGPAIAAR